MWSICLIETTFYHSLSLLLFYLPAPFFPSTSDQTAFLSVVHFHILLSSPPSFLLPPSYINYLLPQSATSGSCFTFSCPFITPASFRSLSRAPILKKKLLSITETSLFRALLPSHQSPHYPTPLHHSPLLPSFHSLIPVLPLPPPSPASQQCIS